MIGSIGRGYVVFLGVKQGDTLEDAGYLAEKTAALRIFPDEQLRMNRSIMEVGGSILVIHSSPCMPIPAKAIAPASFWRRPRSRLKHCMKPTWPACAISWEKRAWPSASSRR